MRLQEDPMNMQNPQNPQYTYTQQQPYGYTAPQQPQKKPRPIWPWLVGGAVLLFLLIVGAVILGAAAMPAEDAAHSFTAGGEDYIAVLHVEGTMAQQTAAYSLDAQYDHDYLLTTLEDLTEDESNCGLLLYIDSPGGELMAGAELGDAIAAYKETTGRPVYAYGHNYAASGGYWVAAPADVFYMNPYGITGSIGVTYGTMVDLSGLLERYGVKTHTITSGAQKAMGSMLEPMSEETVAIFQSMIDEYYQVFLDWVCAQRGMKEEVLRPLADGRIYTANQAKACGLVDEVGKYEDCLDAILAVCGEECEVRDFMPVQEADLMQMLMGMQAEESELAVLLQQLPPSGLLTYYNEAQ